MKVEILKDLKNICFSLLKLCLSAFFIYIICLFCVNEFKSFVTDLNEYFKVRGMETYGVETIGHLNEQGKNEYEYIYTVDGVDYTLISSPEYSSSGGTLNILYDSLDHSIAVESKKLTEITTFYTDEISDLIFIYFKLLSFTVVFGILWYLLDVIKYSKKIWKQYV